MSVASLPFAYLVSIMTFLSNKLSLCLGGEACM